MVTATSSLTYGANAPKPKSDRNKLAVASKPAQSFCACGCVPILFNVASRTTDLVTSFMVKSPVILAVVSPVVSMDVDVNVIMSPSAAPKKSPDIK